MTEDTLPIGYVPFHKKQLFNFQFNRWYTLGFARYEDMEQAGKRIHSFSDWKPVLIDLAEKAEQEKRYKNAAIYYRAAEFYITQKDPDKLKFYDKFIELFYKEYEKVGVTKHKIPYQKSFLHAMHVPAKGKLKGTILMHGGFDSFVEEFYTMMAIFAQHGYEVIAYEGPGQGGTRRKYNLAWDEHWEKPTKAALDFFKKDDVTIYGISMGGHLCLRAAAFEPRIKRVISSGGALDYWKIPGPISRGFLKLFLKFPNFTTKQLVKKMNKDEHHNWFVENSMYISKKDDPLDAMLTMFSMTEKNAQPKNITQDVLVLTGRNDHFIPIKMHNLLLKSLTNAQSVKGIVYTKDTQAHNHCQIGNIPLVTKDILEWLEQTQNNNF